MRAYLITSPKRIRVAGTNADAKTTRDGLITSQGLKKKDVTISDHEIPVSKAELLKYVNDLYMQLDKA